MALRAIILLLALAAGPARAETDAQAVFDAGDRALAAELWLGAARAGDAEAAFKLAQMHDLGLGLPRDPDAAIRWYGVAADAGLATAAFNLGVLLDQAGRRTEAAGWYSRAAAAGHARAQYNLASLHAAGDGVPANPDIARYWYDEAARVIPAAGRAAAPPADRPEVAAAPELLGDVLIAAQGASDDTAVATFAWTAPPDPSGRPFAVEWLALAGEEAGRVLEQRVTAASALRVEIPAGSTVAWRVGRAGPDGAAEAPSPWRRLASGGTGPAADPPTVELRVERGDTAALDLARELVGVLDRRGVASRLNRTSTPIARTEVASAPSGRALAREIAGFLPVLTPGDVVPSADVGAAGVIVSIAAGSRDRDAAPPMSFAEDRE